MIPDKGTPEYRLWVAATEVAIAAPIRQGTNSYYAQVPWSQVWEVRAALDALGIDWKKAKTRS